MASSVPASLRSSGIVPLATRAAQIEKAKPVVAYWCNYWIVQQLLAKGLHNTDDESKAYTLSLMEALEQSKTDLAGEDAVVDDVAAKAYLEQFGLEVFARADNAIRANKATKQTADTFQAAYTFLELLQIWPPLDPEVAAKIKFAKYHALRIAKAIKAGEDPNLSNPSPDPTPAQEVAPLDPQDPEVRALGGLDSSHVPHQPSVEEVPDEHDQLSPSLARTSNLDESLHPSRVGSTAPTGPGYSAAPSAPVENYYQQPDGGDVSPLEPSSHGRQNSEGGGYFPHVQASSSNLPPQPSDPHSHSAAFDPYGQASAPAPISPIQPSPTDSFPPQPQYPPQPPAQAPSFPPQQPSAPDPSFQPQSPAHQPPAPRQHVASPAFATGPPQQHWQPPPPAKAPPVQPVVSQPAPANYVVDDEAISKAQKHARWAISALNFEDVGTAVQELQGALKALGAG